MICVSYLARVRRHALGMLWLLLFWLATPATTDFDQRLVDYAASHQLGPRLGVRETVRPSLKSPPLQALALRVEQLAALKLEMEAVAALAAAGTSQERARLAAGLLPQFQRQKGGLPTGAVKDVPHLPFTTYLELSELLYQKVAPSPALVDAVYASFRREREQGRELESAAAAACSQLAELRPQVTVALELEPGDARLPSLELALWGSYFESRFEHEAWLQTWEAQTQSLFLLILTHLAEVEATGLTGPPPDLNTPAARAGRAAGREVRAQRDDLEAALSSVVRHWRPAYKPQFAGFLRGYLEELKATPGPLFQGSGFTVQVPWGWLLQTTPADLHVMDPLRELQLSLWSHQEGEQIDPSTIVGIVDARLRADENLTDVQGPRPFANGTTLWEARQPALGTTWKVVSVHLAPAPCTTWLILIATGPPQRQGELEPLLQTVLTTLKPGSK